MVASTATSAVPNDGRCGLWTSAGAKFAPSSAGRGSGLAALKSRPRGRPAGLDAAQCRELMRALTGGAVAEGFATDLWTLRRVAQLIERRFARPYSKSQVWRILVSLGLPPLVPLPRAVTDTPLADVTH